MQNRKASVFEHYIANKMPKSWPFSGVLAHTKHQNRNLHTDPKYSTQAKNGLHT
jgi:hypothetical protein